MHRNHIPVPPPRWRGMRRLVDYKHPADRGSCCCGDDGLVVQLCFEGIGSGVALTNDRSFVNNHGSWFTADTGFEREWTWRR